MIKHSRTVILSILVACSLSTVGARAATAESKLPDPATAGFAEQLYRLDCGQSLANDESVWTPGENVGRSIEFSSTCWLIKAGNKWVLWDTGVPQATLNDPKGWSTLPKLIVYHLDKTITGQLAEIGLKTSDVTYVALSHNRIDHFLGARVLQAPKDASTGQRGARGALVGLAALEAEITFLLSGRQEQIRARSERALLHLQRSLIVDADISRKWKKAFGTNEVACEKLGSVHLLSHGIYAFKVDASGARTDLVFNEPPPDALLAQAVEGMVLTEWKLV